MAKYNGPVCRFCRREQQKLFLKGERCFSDKCAFERKKYPPGQHGQRRAKVSEYGLQLREKQKVRRSYGMMEKPFRTMFEGAAKTRGVTAENFFRRLELRLDNVVYRMGMATSRQEAKQIVRHNHVEVNGQRCNIPSAQIAVGDTVKIREKSQSLGRLPLAADLYAKRPPLPWIEVDHKSWVGKVIAAPTRDDIQMNVKERMIVELYSK